MQQRSLIVNADDFGMAPAVDRGILEAAAGGVVRATSVMTNAPGFEESMQRLAASGAALDAGLHATLTWGRPLSPPEKVPTLVDREGRFHKRIELLERALTGRVAAADVERELRLQCERLAAKLPAISHLDGHHHVHAFPVVAPVVERLAREFRIPFVRSPREGFWSPWSWASVRRLVVASLPASRPAYWRSRGFRTPDHFGGFALGAGPDMQRHWSGSIPRIPEGLCEFMVHPGYTSGADLYDAGREQEVQLLSDPSLLERIRREGVAVTTFAEMAR